MSTLNAPVKNTSGEGFVFEEKVGAYFACHLLAGLPFPDPAWGTLIRLDLQLRVDGWHYDDLVTTHVLGGDLHRCGFSIKSNRQLKTTGASTNLVKAAWHHFGPTGPAKFNLERDRLGYIGIRHTPEVTEAFAALTKLAREQDPADMNGRIGRAGYVSPVARTLYRSFRPARSKPAVIPARLLARFSHLEFDFDRDGSSRLMEALQTCRAILDDTAAAGAGGLWLKLMEIVRDCRTAGGYLDAPKLLAKLRPHFLLRGHPDFRSDRTALANHTAQALSRIPDSLGGRVSLLRTDERHRLDRAAAAGRVVAVVGESGSGKTTLLRHWLLARPESSRGTVWISIRDLERRSTEGLEQILTLSHPLADALNQISGKEPVLVLDGLEHAYSDETYHSLQQLLNATRSTGDSSVWRIIISCQLEDWDRVRQRLARRQAAAAAAIAIDVVQIGHFDANEREPLVAAFPALSSLVVRPHLGPILRRPKFLDLLVQNSASGSLPRLGNWVGESDLINWWWDTVVGDSRPGSVRQTVAREAATWTADKLASSLPADQVNTGHGGALGDLVAARVFEESEGRITFAHDLYSDWVRQRALLAQLDRLPEFLLPRVELPTWRKAVRLLGLHLLEQSSGLSAWNQLRARFSGVEDKRNVLVSDLLLESVIFASDSAQLLDRVWPELIADNGRLLGRLLRSFQHVATFPHPKLVAIFREQDPTLELNVAARHRLPFWQYWIPMLGCLGRHAAEAIAVQPVLIAEITARWLNSTPSDWPQRRAAGTLAVLNGQRALRAENAEYYGAKWSTPAVVYRALLLASAEYPEAAEALALKLSGRRSLEAPDIEKITPAQIASEAKRVAAYRSKKIPTPPTIPFSRPDYPQKPWPDGPLRPSCREFQKAFFDDSAAETFILHCPKGTAEVILALLQEPPESRVRHETHHDNHGFQYIEEDYPPFHTKGPFSAFLRHHPDLAITTIGKLATFATDRAAETSAEDEDNWMTVSVSAHGETKAWRGNRQAYFWYRYPLITEDTVTSALMALEKWLYDRHEAGDKMEPWFEKVLASGDSVALPGLLLGFGKRFPEFLTGWLWPFFATYRFQLWEAQYVPTNEGHGGGGGVTMSHAENQLMHQWNTMPHRTTFLSQLSLQMFLYKPELRPRFEAMRKEWGKAANQLSRKRSLGIRRSAARYVIANWKKKRDGTWEYHEPKHLQDPEGKRPYEERLAFGGLVYNLRDALNKRSPFPDAEAAKGWKLLNDLHRYQARSKENPFQTGKADVMAGLIAVLTVLAPAWLARYPKKRATCQKLLIGLIEQMRGRVSLEYRDFGDIHCDCFAAEAFPSFWADDPDDAVLRTCASKLTIATGDTGLRLLLAGAASHRGQLGSGFQDLQHLALRWAIVLKTLYWQRFSKETFNVEAWIQEWVGLFVTKKMPAPPRHWTDILTPAEFPPDDGPEWNQRSYRRRADVDPEAMTAACAWACPLHSSDEPEFRAEKIRVRGELLAMLLRTFPAAPKFAVDGTPYRSDRKILEQTALMILTMEESEQAEQFWKPIMNLGSPAHYWVETFLTSLLLSGLRNPAGLAMFERTWRAMLEHAFADAHWNDPTTRTGYQLEGLWEHLLGMDSIVSGAWEDEHEQLLTRMAPYYQRWASVWLGRRRGGTALVHLLRRNAARGLVLPALEWLLPVWQELDTTKYRDRHDEDSYTQFLGFLWEKWWPEIQENAPALKSFKELAAKLAVGQIPLALEVSARLAMAHKSTAAIKR